MEVKFGTTNVNSTVSPGTLNTGANARTGTANASTGTEGLILSQAAGLSDAQNEGANALNEDELKGLTQKLNEQMKSLKADIEFGFSNEIDGLYIKVTDPKTGEVIRQIPSEEAMRLQEYFKNAVGLLFNKES